MQWVNCAKCGTPCGVYSTGFYHCRSCGHEQVRESELYSRDEAAYVEISIEQARQSGRPRSARPTAGAGLVSFIDK
jgi:hypothetical protein